MSQLAYAIDAGRKMDRSWEYGYELQAQPSKLDQHARSKHVDDID